MLANVSCVLVYPCQNREFALVPEIARADNVPPIGTLLHISGEGTPQEIPNREAGDENHCDDGDGGDGYGSDGFGSYNGDRDERKGGG